MTQSDNFHNLHDFFCLAVKMIFHCDIWAAWLHKGATGPLLPQAATPRPPLIRSRHVALQNYQSILTKAGNRLTSNFFFWSCNNKSVWFLFTREKYFLLCKMVKCNAVRRLALWVVWTWPDLGLDSWGKSRPQPKHFALSNIKINQIRYPKIIKKCVY